MQHLAFFPTFQEPVQQAVGEGKALINRLCADLEPWQIVLYTGSVTASAILLKQFLFHDDESKFEQQL